MIEKKKKNQLGFKRKPYKESDQTSSILIFDSYLVSDTMTYNRMYSCCKLNYAAGSEESKPNQPANVGDEEALHKLAKNWAENLRK